MRIAFIGLGIMGSRMAANLLKDGHELFVHNRTKDKARHLLDKGAKWADTPAKVTENCDVVITMLSQPEVVEEMALGQDGFLKTLSPTSSWIDCSTVNPNFSKKMAELSSAYGISFIDAPVAGTKQPAENGELVFLAGGSNGHIEKFAPLFECMGKKTILLGENGNGSAMKMLVNQLLAQSMVAFSEAMVLGEAMGIKQETLFDVLLNFPVTPPYLSALRAKLESGDHEANFPLKWMQKDAQLIAQSAFEHGVSMPSLNTVKEVFAMAKQKGYGDLDFSAIYEFMKEKK